jgi:tryptophanase
LQEQFGYQAFTVAHYRRFALELATLADQTHQGMRLAQALAESLRKVKIIIPGVPVSGRNNASRIGIASYSSLDTSGLRAVYRIASQAGVPVVLDAARAFENAELIRQREGGQAGRTLPAIVRDLCACSDAAATSLTKDFRVPTGGFVATRKQELATTLIDLAMLAFGDGLSPLTRGAIAQGLSRWHEGDDDAAVRVETVKQLWVALKEAGVPVLEPAGGHAVFVDAARLLDHLAPDANPAATLSAALYEVAGIRTSVHFATAQQEAAGMALLRLTVPLGAPRETLLAVVPEGFRRIADDRRHWRGLKKRSADPGRIGELTARYQLPETAFEVEALQCHQGGNSA